MLTVRATEGRGFTETFPVNNIFTFSPQNRFVYTDAASFMQSLTVDTTYKVEIVKMSFFTKA